MKVSVIVKAILLSVLTISMILPMSMPSINVSAYSTSPSYYFEQGLIGQKPTPVYGGTITYATNYDFTNWNGIINYWTDQDARAQVLERLVVNLGGDNYQPQLATSWTTSPDGKVWTFKLRQGVLWSDGYPFTADDVVWHWNMMSIAKNAGTLAWWTTYDLKNVTAIDASTVRFTFGKIVNTVGQWTGWSSTLILPKHLYQNVKTVDDLINNPANLHPIGTGSYTMQTYVPGQYVIFQRNPLYWGLKPYLDTVIFKYIYTPEGIVAAMKAGEVDANLASIPPNSIDDLTSAGEFKVLPHFLTYSWRITYNFRPEAISANPWVNNPLVRQAMYMAIDRDSIIKNLYNGYSQRIDGPVANTTTYYDKTLKPVTFDPEGAKKLLDQAGYKAGANGVRFSFTMPIYSSGADVGEIIKEMWNNVGIECTLNAVEDVSFYSLYETSKTGLGANPCCLNTMLHTTVSSISAFANGQPRGVENCGWYNNTVVNTAFENFRNTADTTIQRQAAYTIQGEMHKDLAYLWLFTPPSNSVYRAKFTGFEVILGFPIAQKRLIWDTSLAPKPTPTPTPTPTPAPSGGIPGYPMEALIVGLVIAIVVVVFLSRKRI